GAEPAVSDARGAVANGWRVSVHAPANTTWARTSVVSRCRRIATSSVTQSPTVPTVIAGGPTWTARPGRYGARCSTVPPTPTAHTLLVPAPQTPQSAKKVPLASGVQLVPL